MAGTGRRKMQLPSDDEEDLQDIPEIENEDNGHFSASRAKKMPLIDEDGDSNDDLTNNQEINTTDEVSNDGSDVSVPSTAESNSEGLLRNEGNRNNLMDIPNAGTDRISQGEEGAEDSMSDDMEDVPAHSSDSEESLPSVSGEAEGGLQAQIGPVAGFRVHVGEDGEEIMEFASESDNNTDSDDSDDEDYHAALGVEPAVEFALPTNVVSSIANRVVGRYANRIVSRIRMSNPFRVEPQPQDRDRAQGENPEAGPSAPQAPRQSSSRQTRKTNSKKTRKRKRRAKKKQPPQRKPKPPPKPLGPLTIHQDWDGNDEHKTYKKLISQTQYRLVISFKNESQQQESGPTTKKLEDCEVEDTNIGIENHEGESNAQPGETAIEKTDSGYLIGQIQFDRCSTHTWTWETKNELLAAHPGIIDLQINIGHGPGSSILHMKTQRVLQGEAAIAEGATPPKLSKKDSQRELIFVVTQHYYFHVDPVFVPLEFLSTRALGCRKLFTLDFHKFDKDKQCFIINVILQESAILGDHNVHEIPVLKYPLLQDVFRNFCAVPVPPSRLEQGDAHQKEDISWFYGQIRKYHKQNRLPKTDIELQPSSLKPKLREYQRDAVHWMLYREGCLDNNATSSSSSDNLEEDLITAFLNKMYFPVSLKRHSPARSIDPETKQVFYNPYTAYFCLKKPALPPVPSGGILCDEMGLGKTVEMLSLILLNQKQVPDELKGFFESKSLSETPKVESSDDENDESSSSWETLGNSGEESTDSGSKRKRKKRSVPKSRKKKKAKVQSEVRKTRRGKRRPPSPCEFLAATSDQEDTRAGPSSPQKRVSVTAPSMTISEAIEARFKASRRNSKDGSKPLSNFDALSIIYDAELNQHKYAEMAKCTPKFHGKFYDIEIELREFFECICGESEEYSPKEEIVKCSVCCSSQHADCVGFDIRMKMLFDKLKRSYLCPHCETLQPPFETKSTLIITPQSISHQWIREIQKHVQNHRLSILFYKGVSTHGYIPPAKLASYDLVITTYNVLSTELDYVDLPHCNSADGRRLRNPKRFLTIPSPLPSVKWWRLCLDEAQMVEGIGTKMALMAQRLNATHRWCVTGTPINKGLQDLFGLFVFLKLYPISYDIWWNELVQDSFIRKDTSLLYNLFGEMIWRNGKNDVLDQLGIPPQTERVHWLNFSPVETHFYKQQFEICSTKIMEKINRLRQLAPDINILEAKLSSLDRFSLHGLLAPFLELRQACCHPQIVKGKLISLQKGTMTMEELLDRLVKKAQMECHEDHRKLVSSLNGMAGLLIIQACWVEAADKYRQVLQSAEKHKEHFQTDSLQLLHTMENLAELLDQNHDGVPFTLRDASLRTDCDNVREKYMEKYADAVKSAQNAVSPLTQSVEEIYEQFTMKKESWWVAALKSAQRIQKADHLIHTLKQDLQDVTKKNPKTSLSLADKFHDRYGLQQILTKIICDMQDNRDVVLEGLEELQNKEPKEFVESAIRCHLRENSSNYYNDTGLSEGKCQLCTHHDNFLFYESLIFKTDKKNKISRTGRNYQKRKIMGDLTDELTEQSTAEFLQQEAEDLKTTTEHVQLINEELRRGTWGDSEAEVILKGILRFSRIYKLNQDILSNGNVHIKLLDTFKREFKFLRILWRQIFDQVSALDELSQATTRLIALRDNTQQNPQPSSSSNKANLKQLKSGIVEKNLKLQNINLIGFHEIEIKMTEMNLEHGMSQDRLSLHLGQLLYLKTLKKNGYGKKGTMNTEDCPICSIQLGKEWSVLRCGHSFCSDCVKKMCPNTLHTFSCPLCRHDMKFSDVSFVDTNENETEENSSNNAFPSTSSISKDPPKTVREVKGSHSTKVEAIVETLLQLQETHPGEKCIIFSSWSDVLEIIAKALHENDILYSLLNQSGRRAFHENLDKFKEREDIQVLLMPLTSGAKGLNIIEATHVLLVEPILNLASELQAIGRVHRIGQMKPTFVHRFYIKRTIEDKLYTILRGQDISSDEEGSLTVKDLQSLVSSVQK